MGTIGIFSKYEPAQLTSVPGSVVRFRECAGCGERHNPNASCTAPSTRMDGPDMVPGPNAARIDKQWGL